MLRFTAVCLGLLIFSQHAFAGRAGQVIFAAGDARVAGQKAAEGSGVQEGDMLDTGVDGFIYVKTIDDGLFILRPKTRARIVTYSIDAANPENTRIKLELLSGVARSRSGNAVKLARQNFRFNTPVAAIGVRGTDFTVFTDQDLSRVSVISGGVVVSGFVGACRPDGAGPCEGAASRELLASQRGSLLQVRRGQSVPLLMQGGVGPDQISPPQSGEPGVKGADLGSSSTLPSNEPSLDAKKSQSLADSTLIKPIAPTPVEPVPPPVPEIVPPPVPDAPPVAVEVPPPVIIEPPVVIEQPVVVIPPVVIVPPVEAKDSQVIWGRWQPIAGVAPTIDFEAEKANAELIALKGNFVLFRSSGRQFVSPNEGVVGFKLQSSEAYISNDDFSAPKVEAARLENGNLSVDFGKRTFATSFTAFTKTEGMTLRTSGVVTANGSLYGDQQFSQRGYIDVEGALSNADGGSAAYIFSGRIDDARTINGVTFWKK